MGDNEQKSQCWVDTCPCRNYIKSHFHTCAFLQVIFFIRPNTEKCRLGEDNQIQLYHFNNYIDPLYVCVAGVWARRETSRLAWLISTRGCRWRNARCRAVGVRSGCLSEHVIQKFWPVKAWKTAADTTEQRRQSQSEFLLGCHWTLRKRKILWQQRWSRWDMIVVNKRAISAVCVNVTVFILRLWAKK